MSKIEMALVCAVLLSGCRTSYTPDQSWADYHRYYSPSGETALAPAGAAHVQEVASKNAEATVATLKAQGYVVLGCFKIDDGTEISRKAVALLAQKLNAGEVVWCSVDTLASHNGALPNPDMGIVGVDKLDMARMNSARPDQTATEQALETHHTIWMLGKKAQ